MAPKAFIKANDLVRDAFALARLVFDSGFRPEALVVLWRGGTPVGMVIHELLLYKGIRTYHTAVKAESYTGIEKRIEPVIERLESVNAALKAGSRVLVVDGIFDTGCTVKKVKDLLTAKTHDVRIATLYYREGNRKVDIAPDFYLRKTDRWIVFPHELIGLAPDEIRTKDPFIHDLLA